MNSVTTKRSPIVLIRLLILIELAAVLFYLTATMLDDYKYQIYAFLPLSALFSYQALKLPFLSGAQLFITIYAFLRWYYEAYTVRPGSVSRQWGVFFKKEKTIPLDKSMIVTLRSSPLGKLLHYGSIRIENAANRNLMVLADISRPQNLLKTVEQSVSPQAKIVSDPDPHELLKKEEHENLEFKSTFRFDHKSGQVNRELEKSAMKTVAAFLNSKGGYLFIGVDDERAPVGLVRDYQTLHRQNSDGFENHFTQLFNTMIGPEFRQLLKLSFHQIDGHEVCLVQTRPSARPVYLKADGNEHFYVRTGNATTPLKLSEIELYARSRWPRRTSNV